LRGIAARKESIPRGLKLGSVVDPDARTKVRAYPRSKGKLTAYWGESYFPALDGVRAICILLVMFNHVHEPVPRGLQGRIGVDIFFVLSGFLITTLLLRERERHGNVSLKGFYTRRFFRIVPVYALVVVVYLGVAFFSHDAVRWREFKSGLPYLLTFMQEYRPATTGVMLGHAWSLGIEEKFYLVWPLLLAALFPFRRRSIAVTLILGIGILFLPPMLARSYGGLLLGALLAIVLAKSSSTSLPGLLLRVPTDVAVLLVAVGSLGMTMYGLPVLFFSACVTLLIGTLVLRRSWLRAGLEARWIVTCGRRSYAMYLIHVLVIDFVERVEMRGWTLRWYVVIPMAYGLSFLGATVIFYAVEQPCVRYGRRAARGMRESLTKRLPLGPGLADVKAIRDPI
jgi:peptidoglycan/LPS O-acetylase OafA/YrhL